jgi:tripartite-type tricarboxylate transporter receptor subunit TctC
MTRWMFACACAASALVLGLAPPASAAWPDRPIRLVLPFPAGGPTDTLGRQLAQQLQTALGQGVVVDNRASANSAIGSDIVAKSPADGYTLLFNASLFASNPHLMTLPYDIHRDFTPIALIAKAPLLIAVNRDLPVKDVRDLIAYARSNPGRLNFGIGSNGSAGHLAQASGADPLQCATGSYFRIREPTARSQTNVRTQGFSKHGH